MFLVSVPFYGFPKILVKELRELIREDRWQLDSIRDLSGTGQDDHDKGRRTSYSKNIRGNNTLVNTELAPVLFLLLTYS